MKTEFEPDCPWCSGPMTVAADTSSDAVSCPTCSIVVELAADPAVREIALAA
jgi:hypothetical protein